MKKLILSLLLFILSCLSLQAQDVLREFSVKRFADHQIEHGIAEELHAFIAVEPVVGDGRVRQ